MVVVLVVMDVLAGIDMVVVVEVIVEIVKPAVVEVRVKR